LARDEEESEVERKDENMELGNNKEEDLDKLAFNNSSTL
jgi:hypothetical protein